MVPAGKGHIDQLSARDRHKRTPYGAYALLHVSTVASSRPICDHAFKNHRVRRSGRRSQNGHAERRGWHALHVLATTANKLKKALGGKKIPPIRSGGTNCPVPSNLKPRSFSVRDWTGYPSGTVPKPTGPFRLLEGAEYEAARKAANQANAALRRADPAKFAGKQIHEIQPVKYGGSPTDPANKIALTPQEHAQYTNWWNRFERSLKP